MLGRRHEVSHQLVANRAVVGHPLDGVGHVHQPPVPLQRTDVEGHVPHSQLRMTTLLHVRRGSAPVLGEEERQAMFGTVEVRLVRVQRPQNLVGDHAGIELVHQANEEVHASDPVVEHHLVAHENSGSVQPGKTSGRPSLTFTGKFGGRFSRKLITPSRASSLAPRELMARESTRWASMG